MKVALFLSVDYNRKSLPQQYVKGLYDALLYLGHEVRLISPFPNTTDHRLLKQLNQGLVPATLETSETTAFLHHERFQIIHFTTPLTLASWQTARSSRTLNVLTFLPPSSPFSLWTRILLTKIQPHLHGTIYPNRVFAERARSRSISQQIIPFGIDTGRFKPLTSTEDKNEARRHLGLPPDQRLTWLYHQQSSKDQDVLEVIDALEILNRLCPNTRLVIIGRGDSLNKARQTAMKKHLKNIRFVGEPSETTEPKFYQAADLFCGGSREPSLGLGILKAFASGLPVAAYENPVSKELMDNENREFLVPSGEPEQMANKLYLLIMDHLRRRRIGERNRLLSENQYSWKIIGRKTIDYYRELQANRGPGPPSCRPPNWPRPGPQPAE